MQGIWGMKTAWKYTEFKSGKFVKYCILNWSLNECWTVRVTSHEYDSSIVEFLCKLN